MWNNLEDSEEDLALQELMNDEQPQGHEIMTPAVPAVDNFSHYLEQTHGGLVPEQAPTIQNEEAAQMSPADVPEPAPQISPEEAKQSAMREYLQQQYARDSLDRDDFRKSRERANTVGLIADVGHGLETIGRATSMANGGAGVNHAFYENLKKEPVHQKRGDDAFMRQLKIESMMARDMMARGNFEQKQKAAEFLQNMATRKQDFHEKSTGIKAERDLSEAEKKATAAELKAYQKLNYDALNPKTKAVTKALDAIASGDKAMDLVNAYATDLNKMPNQEATLYALEMANLATGGQSNLHMQEKVLAESFASKIANFKSKYGNKPEPAQLKEFLEHNIVYVENLINTNRRIVSDYRKGLLLGEKRISPELKSEYRNNFKEDFAPPKPHKMAPGQGVDLWAPDGKLYNIPADKAEKFIKEHKFTKEDPSKSLKGKGR